MSAAQRQPPEPLAIFLWYTIPGSAEEPLDVTREQMKGWLEEAGIDPAIMTVEVYPVNVFRSSTTGMVDQYEIGDTPVKLIVREAGRSDTQVTRHVIRQWVDGAGVPRESKVADLQFIRPRRTAAGRVHGSEELRTSIDKRLSGVDKESVAAFVKRCVVRYEVNLDLLPPHAMRAMIRNFLVGLGGVAVADSGGGAYLIAPEHRRQLAALRDIVRRSGQGCRLHFIPVVDEPELREMVLESVEADVTARAYSLMAELTDWTSKNPEAIPTVQRWSAWRSSCGLLTDHLMDHSARYHASFDQATAALERLAMMIDDWGLRVASRGRG